ncbi:hypothetical protein [Streptomyces fumanus]|uniref:hypothetical protein n=1 Tax=Streptomyces fumanus TaxID=67302 RepID=UPI0033FD70CB
MTTYDVILVDGTRVKIEALRWTREEDLVSFFGATNKTIAVFSLRNIAGVAQSKALRQG